LSDAGSSSGSTGSAISCASNVNASPFSSATSSFDSSTTSGSFGASGSSGSFGSSGSLSLIIFTLFVFVPKRAGVIVRSCARLARTFIRSTVEYAATKSCSVIDPTLEASPSSLISNWINFLDLEGTASARIVRLFEDPINVPPGTYFRLSVDKFNLRSGAFTRCLLDDCLSESGSVGGASLRFTCPSKRLLFVACLSESGSTGGASLRFPRSDMISFISETVLKSYQYFRYKHN